MNLRSLNIIQRLKEKYSDNDTTNFNILDFVAAFGSPLNALMYSRLFWPEFVEIEGMIFLSETIEDERDRDQLTAGLANFGGDRRLTEKSFNLVEIPSGIFSRAIGESADEENLCLANILAEMWSAKLALVYPDRRFTVQVLKPEETGGEFGLTFFNAV